jgi:hypothetical protein
MSEIMTKFKDLCKELDASNEEAGEHLCCSPPKMKTTEVMSKAY